MAVILFIGKQWGGMGPEGNVLSQKHFLSSGEVIKHSSGCQTVVLDYEPNTSWKPQQIKYLNKRKHVKL